MKNHIKSFFNHVGAILLLIACVVGVGYSLYFGGIAVMAMPGVYQFPIYASVIITLCYLYAMFVPEDQSHII